MKPSATELKDVVTISELAFMLGMSRGRFYQLVTQGVFPPPSRNPTTQRPFYDREQQRTCLEIRRTNRGANGQPILFYSRHIGPSAPKRSEQPSSSSKSKQPSVDSELIEQLQDGLTQLGLPEVSRDRIRVAVQSAHPNGHATVELSDLLRTIYRELRRRNSPDNVTR